MVQHLRHSMQVSFSHYIAIHSSSSEATLEPVSFILPELSCAYTQRHFPPSLNKKTALFKVHCSAPCFSPLTYFILEVISYQSVESFIIFINGCMASHCLCEPWFIQPPIPEHLFISNLNDFPCTPITSTCVSANVEVPGSGIPASRDPCI